MDLILPYHICIPNTLLQLMVCQRPQCNTLIGVPQLVVRMVLTMDIGILNIISCLVFVIANKQSSSSAVTIVMTVVSHEDLVHFLLSIDLIYLEHHRPEPNRYANTSLESMVGQIFELSKDQHGCRFLQKKIDEDKTVNLSIIFNEVKSHVVELMKDSFGNYLCQKLLEFCTNEQRTVLVNNAAPSMVEVATNQHGTRALQKMIESVDTPDQIQVIVNALKNNVVALIQDLNGNHVIQKCLNHLRSEDAQFIFDAVGSKALEVGSHRHGCCVLQRCIDHAAGPQQERLITQTIAQAYYLMQDPYGNYVVQYIREYSIVITLNHLLMITS
jgi:hypothetical protein